MLAEPKPALTIAGSLGIGLTATERSVDEAAAAVGASPSKDGNGSEAANKADVEDNREEGKERDTAKEQGQKDTKDAIEHSGARDALNGLPFLSNRKVVICQDRKEVREHAEAENRCKQLDAANGSLAKSQGDTSESHVDEWKPKLTFSRRKKRSEDDELTGRRRRWGQV